MVHFEYLPMFGVKYGQLVIFFLVCKNECKELKHKKFVKLFGLNYVELAMDLGPLRLNQVCIG